MAKKPLMTTKEFDAMSEKPKTPKPTAKSAPSTKPSWKGLLSLGLVTVPVHLYSTSETRSKAPTGHNVHRTCQTQTKQKKWCEKCSKEVPDTELMKGYDSPTTAGKFVELTDDELDSLKTESSKVIQLTSTAHASELEPLMIADTWFLVGDGSPAASDAEAVLVEALRGRVAVGTMVRSGKSLNVAVMVYGNVMLLHVLRTADQMRSFPARTALPDPNETMVELAKQLVDSMLEPLDLSDTTDEYADSLREMILLKADKPDVQVAAVKKIEAPTFSMLDALKASVAAKAKK
jgi:DNA end-binding protein Ku